MSAVKVLLLEDDQWQADVYLAQLRGEGYEVGFADSPHEAMSIIDEFTPDVVIADVLLKGNTIFPLLHELVSYEDTRDLPIVIMTTESDLLEGVNLRHYGVVEVIDKATMGVGDIVAATRRVLHEG